MRLGGGDSQRVATGLADRHPPEAAVHASIRRRRAVGAAVDVLLRREHGLRELRVEAARHPACGHPHVLDVVVVGGHEAACVPLVAGGVGGGLRVVDGLVAPGEADSLGVLLLDLLRHQADLGAGVALVVVAVDRLAVVRLADVLDVLLQPPVGEEAAGLRGGGRRAGERAGAFGDVREELRRLERIRLLLQELVVEGGVLRLLRLLLRLASGELRLRTLQRRPLSPLAKRRKLLRRVGPHVVDALAKVGVGRRRPRTLPVLLLAQRRELGGVGGSLTIELPAQPLQGGPEPHALRIGLVADVGELGGRVGPLTVGLIANALELLPRARQRRPVGCCRVVVEALLLLGRAERLTVPLVQDAGVNLGVGEVLLLVQVRRRDAGAVAAERTRRDGVAELARLRLLVLLVENALGALQHGAEVGAEVLLRVQAVGVDGLSRRTGETGGHLIVRLRPGVGPARETGGGLIEGLSACVGSAVALACRLLIGLSRLIPARQRAQRRARILTAGVEGVALRLGRRAVVGGGRALRLAELVGGGLEIRLRLTGGRIGIRDSRLLCRAQGCNKFPVIGLERGLRRLLGGGVYRVVASENIGWDGHAVSTSGTFPPQVTSPLLEIELFFLPNLLLLFQR